MGLGKASQASHHTQLHKPQSFVGRHGGTIGQVLKRDTFSQPPPSCQLQISKWVPENTECSHSTGVYSFILPQLLIWTFLNDHWGGRQHSWEGITPSQPPWLWAWPHPQASVKPEGALCNCFLPALPPSLPFSLGGDVQGKQSDLGSDAGARATVGAVACPSKDHLCPWHF